MFNAHVWDYAMAEMRQDLMHELCAEEAHLDQAYDEESDWSLHEGSIYTPDEEFEF